MRGRLPLLHLLSLSGIPSLSAGEITTALVGPVDTELTGSPVAVTHGACTIGPEGIIIAVVGARLGGGNGLARGEVDRLVARKGQGADDSRQGNCHGGEGDHLCRSGGLSCKRTWVMMIRDGFLARSGGTASSASLYLSLHLDGYPSPFSDERQGLEGPVLPMEYSLKPPSPALANQPVQGYAKSGRETR